MAQARTLHIELEKLVGEGNTSDHLFDILDTLITDLYGHYPEDD